MCSYLTWPNGVGEKGKLGETCYMYLAYSGCERGGILMCTSRGRPVGRGGILLCNTDYALFTFISIRQSADTNTSNVYLMQPTGGGRERGLLVYLS